MGPNKPSIRPCLNSLTVYLPISLSFFNCKRNLRAYDHWDPSDHRVVATHSSIHPPTTALPSVHPSILLSFHPSILLSIHPPTQASIHCHMLGMDSGRTAAELPRPSVKRNRRLQIQNQRLQDGVCIKPGSDPPFEGLCAMGP